MNPKSGRLDFISAFLLFLCKKTNRLELSCFAIGRNVSFQRITGDKHRGNERIMIGQTPLDK